MKINLIIAFLLFAAGCGGQSQLAASGDVQAAARTNPALMSAPLTFANVDYQANLKAIAAGKSELAAQYRTANQAAKKEVIEKAQAKFVADIDKEILPFWYGTDWDFYGTTEKPGEGKIACGYFVTTVLRDAGVRVNRVSLAQQASENIIKSLTSEPHIQRFRNQSVEKFVEKIKQSGAGLYVVGLDFHVGFILQDNAETYFIHSTYVEPGEVLREKAVESIVLASSKYRVVGKISGDNQFIVKWLEDQSIPTLKR